MSNKSSTNRAYLMIKPSKIRYKVKTNANPNHFMQPLSYGLTFLLSQNIKQKMNNYAKKISYKVFDIINQKNISF